jgi:CRISPR-associated protein Cas5d
MRQFCIEVSGPYACFTRPEMKVERVSYDIITPSAARAIFEAILWKPAILWHIRRIEVLAPVRWVSVRRNEVGAVASISTAQAAMKSGKGNLGIFIEDERQQRAGLFLRDVKYRLFADLEFIPPDKRGPARNPLPGYLIDAEEAQEIPKDETYAKYAAMFERRASKGQCFNQPYLGCREFSCSFRLIKSEDTAADVPVELAGQRDLGWMLYDMDYTDPTDPKPLFFRAQMREGVVQVPAHTDSMEVLG